MCVSGLVRYSDVWFVQNAVCGGMWDSVTELVRNVAYKGAEESGQTTSDYEVKSADWV